MPKQFIHLFDVMLKGIVGFVGRMPLAQDFSPEYSVFLCVTIP